MTDTTSRRRTAGTNFTWLPDQRLARVSLGFLVIVVLAAVFAPLLAPADPNFGQLSSRQLPPLFFGGDSQHILGTDSLGRDVLSRIIFGGRVSLSLAVLSIVFAGAFGTLVGLVAGYFGGKWDAILMRLTDIVLSFPAILMAIILVALLGASYSIILIVMVALLWPFYARQVRGEALVLRDAEYVVLSKVAGSSTTRILAKHVFPNVVPSLLVLATLQIGQVILLAATLSFLGVGVPPPTPDWGAMVSEGQAVIGQAWWIAVFPGLVICLVVLSANVLGDWLRDALDPRVSRSRS